MHMSLQGSFICGKKYDNSSRVIFGFPGCWSADDWFSGNAFGEKQIDLSQFPSLKSLATEEVATVNEAFLKRFQVILENVQQKVEKYVKKGKEIVFTGYSSGGPIAVLVTVWFLQEQFKKPNVNNKLSPLCLTFGSPLVGDHIFNHALSRENWSSYFTHFVMRYDIVPRVLLAPPSSIKQQIVCLLNFLKQKSTLLKQESSMEASTLYESVVRNVSSVASHAACQLMGDTNNLSETLSIFVKFCPYRPFGTYVFCTEEELVVVKNPDAVLQMLFYSSQSPSEQELPVIAMRSIKDHRKYQSKLQSFEKQNVIHLDSKKLPLYSDCHDVASSPIDKVLNNLGLGIRARLCLCAAREFEEQKVRNQNNFDAKKESIKERIDWLEKYKASCENHKVSYYDAFKVSSIFDDFNANVKRLELAGILDELMEVIKKGKLPDRFEGNSVWIAIGTRHRRIVEPLDIANYYRHGKIFDTKAYMAKGSRPKRYRFPQNWHEYARRMETGSSWESCFWAEVEDLDICLKKEGLSDDVKKRIYRLEENVKAWISREELGRDVFFDDSTFIKWWETLPAQYRLESSFSGFISKQQIALKGV